jgi:hypothetical protein
MVEHVDFGERTHHDIIRRNNMGLGPVKIQEKHGL